jgi:hypothetical protein
VSVATAVSAGWVELASKVVSAGLALKEESASKVE